MVVSLGSSVDTNGAVVLTTTSVVVSTTDGTVVVTPGADGVVDEPSVTEVDFVVSTVVVTRAGFDVVVSTKF